MPDLNGLVNELLLHGIQRQAQWREVGEGLEQLPSSDDSVRGTMHRTGELSAEQRLPAAQLPKPALHEAFLEEDGQLTG